MKGCDSSMTPEPSPAKNKTPPDVTSIDPVVTVSFPKVLVSMLVMCANILD